MQEPVVLSVDHNGVTFFNVPLSGKLVTPEGGESPLDIPVSVIQESYDNQEWARIRNKRNKLIAETDSVYLRHGREIRNGKIVDDKTNPTTLSGAQLLELDTYTQELADIPQTYANHEDVVFPGKPLCVDK